jgi:hypothetical protein
VSVALWQTFPLPANPIFTEKNGYGKGCPFTCPYYGREIEYDRADYPETQKLCDSSFVVCSEQHPIYAQELDLMKHYVEAFEKVFANIDEILKIEVESEGEATSGRAEVL